MVFQEPKVEFVSVNTEDIATTSPGGAGYDICQRKGINGMNQASFCSEMGVAGMDLSGIPDQT